MTDVLGYLQSKNLDLRPAPNANVRTLCFFHGEEGDPKTGRLYIKVDPEAEVPGLFWCHRCEASGTLNKIKRHFGDEVIDDEASRGRKIQVLIAASDYYYDCLTKDVDALTYLTGKRGLSLEAIEKFKLGVSDGCLNDHLLLGGFNVKDIRASGLVWDTGRDFFEKGMITIPYFDQGKCVQIRGRDRKAVKNKYKTPPGQKALLFNTDTLMEGEEVILTEGEFDAMVLEDAGYSAVGVPGTRAFQASWVKFFTSARRVYICFDNDDPGKDGAQKVSSVIGAKARVVRMPSAEPGMPKNDPTEYMINQGKGTDAFDLLLRDSSSGHLIRVEDAFEAWLDREGNPELGGMKLGFEKLDATIKPGLLPGQVMVFLARTSHGKTVMMINIMQRVIEVNPSSKILFVSLEQTRNEWFERARRIHGFYHGGLDLETELNQATIKFYRNNLMLVDKNRLTIDDLRTCIRQSEDELGHKISMVVVDYLGYWARGFRGEPYVRTSDAIMGLKEVAKDDEVIILAPHQVNRGSQAGTDIKIDDARESGVIGETADFLLSIMNADKDPGKTIQTATGDIAMKILKSRHGGDGVQIDLKFAPTSLAMVPQSDGIFDDTYYRKAVDEMNWRRAGEYDYARVYNMHLTGDRSIHLTGGHDMQLTGQSR